MKALVLAAGEGKRLRPHTSDKPKCLVQLSGRSLLERQLEVLKGAGINDVSLVSGYRSEQLNSLGLKTYHNPEFASTNMVRSMMCAKELFDGSDDILITYGDVLFEKRILKTIMEPLEAPISIAVNSKWRELWECRMPNPLADAETLKIKDGMVTELGNKPKSYDEIQGQYMGLIRVRAEYCPNWVEFYKELNDSTRNMYMTEFLQKLIDKGVSVRAVAVAGGWLEVDTIEDLTLYEKLNSEGQIKRFCLL